MYNTVKVFSATKARDRQSLGDRLTEWIQSQPSGVEIVKTVVRQSSDREFHCLTFVVFALIP